MPQNAKPCQKPQEKAGKNSQHLTPGVDGSGLQTYIK
jgi:hypothetical protein